MATKLARAKDQARAWKREYNNLRIFMLGVMKIAANRDLRYYKREHGDILNKDCADDIVSLCKMFNGDQYAAQVEKLIRRHNRISIPTPKSGANE